MYSWQATGMMPKVQHLVQSCGLVESCHRWCALGISASASAAKSAAVHRIASLPGVKDTPCTCPENTTHINELALDRETTSHRRGLAEEQFVEHILTTALSWAPAEPGVESKNPADSVPEAELEFPVHVSETIPSLQDTVCCITCPECNLLMPQAAYHCLLCETELTHDPQEASNIEAAFPTEERLAAAERKKKGHIPVKRRKIIEQHFDDCGDNLAPLVLKPELSCFEGISSEDESDVEVPVGLSQSLSCWIGNGSQTAESPELTGQSYLACDIDEMLSTLEKHPGTPWPWGVEIVEICGGRGLTSWFVVKRRLRSGHNFDIIAGTDLTNPYTVRKVLEYIKMVRPLVVVMAPVCTPYSPLGRMNQIINQDAWRRSLRIAEPIAKLCGEIALIQLGGSRHYLVEQPTGSTLFKVAPWPTVVRDRRSLSIAFDQCQVGQSAGGYPAKKSTELVASSQELLKPFVGRTCPGIHQHQVLTGRAASQAQKWPKEMCCIRDRTAGSSRTSKDEEGAGLSHSGHRHFRPKR